MNSISTKELNSSKAIKIFSNLNNYLIKIEYYDTNGIKKTNNNIPLKYVLNKK